MEEEGDLVKCNEQVMRWLLEENNPSVRYYTLKYLLRVEEDNEKLLETQKRIMTNGIVPKILEYQNDNGSFDVSEKFYTSKYKGSSWQLLTLAELGVSPGDLHIQKTCEFILKMSQSIIDGGFSVEHGKQADAGLPSKVIPCLTGNMTWALIKCGYIEDQRVQKAIDWIVKNQRADDGDKPKLPNWAYEKRYACFNKHTCFMGVVKSLKALSVIPEDLRSQDVKIKIDELAEFLLKHHIFKRSHDLSKESKPGWKRFGFPLMYQTDILEILTIFNDLNIKDKRMNDALSLLKTKQTSSGVWLLENTYNGKVLVNIEKKGEPSKWVTLKALTVLNETFEGCLP